MTVNFKTPEGLEILKKLVKKSDVLVENFISGKLASMGLGWEDCKKLNERLIYASITGLCLAVSALTLTIISFSFARLRPNWPLQEGCWL